MSKSRPKVFDSMASAASGLKISLEIVRRAKKHGCSAFRGSRVDGNMLKKYIAEHSDELKAMGDEISLRETKLSEEIRKLRIKNDRDEGKSVPKVEVASAIRRALAGVAGILEAKLVAEWPSAVAGLDPAQARVYGRRLYDDVMVQCQALEKEFPV